MEMLIDLINVHLSEKSEGNREKQGVVLLRNCTILIDLYHVNLFIIRNVQQRGKREKKMKEAIVIHSYSVIWSSADFICLIE